MLPARNRQRASLAPPSRQINALTRLPGLLRIADRSMAELTCAKMSNAEPVTTMDACIEFLFRGEPRRIGGARARMTLLEWLRTSERAVGTKEGCAEGDCGACTVVLARLRGDRVDYQAVNACILLLGQVHGTAVLTVEDLSRGGPLHPVQESMVRHHGSQCGFCTPGIVMSLFALCESAQRPVSRDTIADQLAGNLCRCTGYRPILDAAQEAMQQPAADPADLKSRLGKLMSRPDTDLFVGDGDAFFAAPASEASLQRLLADSPDALMLAGGTDAGLWFTKLLIEPKKFIWLARVAGLDEISRDGTDLVLGATSRLEAAAPHLAALAPDLGEIMRRFGSVQVRNSATVGGSIANASPIGDLAPCLIALDATLELASATTVRTLPLESYFLAYKKQDRRAGEYVRRLIVPIPAAHTRFKFFKVSKRMDEDISTVLAAFAFVIEGRRITAARIAFGGMAGVPARAPSAEQAITGAVLDDPGTWAAAITAIRSAYSPIDDHRGSAEYRRLVAGNLMLKALTELAGAPQASTRIRPEAAHA